MSLRKTKDAPAGRSGSRGWLSPSRAAGETGESPASGFTGRNVAVSFDSRAGTKSVLAGIDFDIAPGQFVSLLGGSGVGKTTLLRIMGGLQPCDKESDVRYGDRPVAGGPPHGCVTVFQDYASSLLPWRTVAKNVALGIERTTPARERSHRVEEALEMVGLSASAQAYPWQLSGGMQQRVQIARALVTRPSALMMDEPFGALDAMTRASLQDSLMRIHQETGTTIIFVTHDVDEAVYLSDRILVLVGTPGRLALDTSVDLPRPRSQLHTRELPEYLHLRRAVYEVIESVHGR